MPAIASGALVDTRFIQEVTFGVTPATPTMQRLRFTQNTLNLDKQVYESNEINSTRGISDQRHGLRTAKGAINFELGLQTFDLLIQAALGGTWAVVTTGSATLAGAAGSFTQASGSFITMGFNVGDEIISSGFAVGNNNARWKVTAVAALTLTVSPSGTNTNAVVVDASAAARTLCVGVSTVTPGKSLKMGSTLTSFTIERGFTNINQWEAFTGMVPNVLTLTCKPGQIVDVQMDFIGKDMAISGASLATGTTPPATNSPFDSFTGTLQENGSPIALITAIDMKIENNRTTEGIVGSKTTPAVFEGRSRIAGKVTVLFQDAVMLTKFLSETQSSIDLVLGDLNGVDFHHINLPRVKYNTGMVTSPKDGPCIIEMGYEGLYDATTTLTNIIYQRSNT